MQSLIPVVMSGIIAVYALVVAVLIAGNMKPPPGQSYSLFNGCMHLACGLSVGFTGMAAGYAIGTVGDSVRGKGKSSQMGRLTRWKGSTRVHATIADIRRHGSHSHLWRSFGAIWVRGECSSGPESASCELTRSNRLIVALILNTRASG